MPMADSSTLSPQSFPQIQTERFTLRRLVPADAPALFGYLSDPEVVRFSGMDPLEDLDQAVWLINRFEQVFQEGRGVRWGICRKGADQLLGAVGFLQWHKGWAKAELGYELAREYWGQGIMSEVIPAVVRHGFEAMALNRIEAIVVPANSASLRVLEKAGFQAEARLEEYLVSDGQFQDGVMCRLLRREYLPEF